MVGVGLSLTLNVPSLGTLFLLLDYLMQSLYKGLCLVLLNFVVPCSVDIPVRNALFWKKTKKQRIWGEGKLNQDQPSGLLVSQSSQSVSPTFKKTLCLPKIKWRAFQKDA